VWRVPRLAGQSQWNQPQAHKVVSGSCGNTNELRWRRIKDGKVREGKLAALHVFVTTIHHMKISGTTELIAHIGFPTHGFKSPLIYNPYFASAGIDAVVVPMGCRAEHFPAVLNAAFSLTNIRGALITMPHKQTCARL